MIFNGYINRSPRNVDPIESKRGLARRVEKWEAFFRKSGATTNK
jgi:hypothetical protein